ncbi:unnamed protein product [Thlaspi arvense]|uniref:non-specific serine/threonine protein kinase n=1 Tax=Thlaspi arvense TaxID=13288 RepID=A0AAU9RWJ6_THLAR|nr:unnamed protein product [Thlaspi arvense]
MESMLRSMKAWILKHSALMSIYIAAAAFAIIAIIIVLLLIHYYKSLPKNPVCDIHTLLLRRLGLFEFSLEEIRETTYGFQANHRVGYGSFGPIYLGFLRRTIAAIKILTASYHPRFLAESKIRHMNMVNILGYCCENGEKIIVYEYMVYGNVRDYLQRCDELNLKKRISIALGAAKGLQHLHSLTPPLSHNRFKTAKVFLDYGFITKVSDEGWSRQVEMRCEEEANDDDDLEVGLHIQEAFNGTSDVFSFGLFLLELLTGEEPGELTTIDELIDWIGPRLGAGTFADQRMDEADIDCEAFDRALKLMVKCFAFPANQRPKMEEVVTELQETYMHVLTIEEMLAPVTIGPEFFTDSE